MEHSFDTDVAAEVGVVPAILYRNILHWVEKNKANGRHLHDGRYWTYNSMPAFQTLFPYLTKRQIEYSLKQLTDKGWIAVGHFADDKKDRTNWYTILKIVRCKTQNCEMSDTNLCDVARAEKDLNTSDPDRSTDINTDMYAPDDKTSVAAPRETAETAAPGTRRDAAKITFDYDGDRRIHGVSEEQYALWAESYPAIDVRECVAAAGAWLDANPRNRKSNVKRFLCSWLARQQDRARSPVRSYGAQMRPEPDKGVAPVYDDADRPLDEIFGGHVSPEEEAELKRWEVK